MRDRNSNSRRFRKARTTDTQRAQKSFSAFCASCGYSLTSAASCSSPLEGLFLVLCGLFFEAGRSLERENRIVFFEGFGAFAFNVVEFPKPEMRIRAIGIARTFVVDNVLPHCLCL